MDFSIVLLSPDEEVEQPVGHLEHALAQVLIHVTQGVGDPLQDRLPLLGQKPKAPPQDVRHPVLRFQLRPAFGGPIGGSLPAMEPAGPCMPLVAGVVWRPVSETLPHDGPVLGDQRIPCVGKWVRREPQEAWRDCLSGCAPGR